jgi:hypothetical protein
MHHTIIRTLQNRSGHSTSNHVLVVMDHGLHGKWKQPVAYYFGCGSTRAEGLHLLSEVGMMCVWEELIGHKMKKSLAWPYYRI